MKKMTKFMSVALAATLAAASLTACGGSGKTETKAADETKAAGEATADGEVFTIAGIGPMTGDAASYGISVKQGAEVAINEINAAGGVQVGDTTYTLNLIFEDDEDIGKTVV